MNHPLLGADLATLRRAFRDGGGVERPGLALGLWASAAARAPASAFERAWLEPRSPRLEDLPPPVFVIGHWRSGTTHLANLMALGPFAPLTPLGAGLPWDMLGLARLFRRSLERRLPADRGVDRMAVTMESPQEDEIALASMTPLSFLHGIYFPRRFDALIDRGLFFDGASEADVAAWKARVARLVRKVAGPAGARALVKNPAHTARPAMLRAMFPGAKFVHIRRNPLDVFLSMRNFHAKMLAGYALQTPPERLDLDATILRVQARLADVYEAQTAGWGAPELVEVAYEELERAPMATLERVFSTLGLEGWAETAPRARAYLDGVKGYRKNGFRADAAAAAKVRAALGERARHWGYDLDAPLGAAA